MEKSFRRVSEDFESFYRRHFQAIYRVCYAFMKNPQDAEDCHGRHLRAGDNKRCGF